MTIEPSFLLHLSDQDLLAHAKRLAARESQATAELIASLGELDARKLYLGEGYSSLFAYCLGALHLSPDATYSRIEVARTARQFPLLLERLAEGHLTLTAARLLAPHLTVENHVRVIEAAKHATKSALDELLARLAPKPDVPSTVRKLQEARRVEVATVPKRGLAAATAVDANAPRSVVLPAEADDRHQTATSRCTPSRSLSCDPGLPAVVQRSDRSGSVEGHPPIFSAPSAASPRSIAKAISPGRYRIQMTVGVGTYEKLRRAQTLLAHRIPDGDIAKVFDRALTLLVDDLERKRIGAAKRPRKPKERQSKRRSRYIPAEVRRQVWKRDGSRCTFIASDGHRCEETRGLQMHHKRPYADGGETTVENCVLSCAAHNRHEGEKQFGFTREVCGPTRARWNDSTPVNMGNNRGDQNTASASLLVLEQVHLRNDSRAHRAGRLSSEKAIGATGNVVPAGQPRAEVSPRRSL